MRTHSITTILFIAALALLAASAPIREDAVDAVIPEEADAVIVLLQTGLSASHEHESADAISPEAEPVHGSDHQDRKSHLENAVIAAHPKHSQHQEAAQVPGAVQIQEGGVGLAKVIAEAHAAAHLAHAAHAGSVHAGSVHAESHLASIPHVKGKEKKEKQEGVTLDAAIETEHMWAFLSLTAGLILGTMVFELFKHKLMHSVVGTPMAPLVNNLFAELTTLGFLGILTFVLANAGLDKLSSILFPHDEDGKAELGEMLEKIHMTIFFIMVLFLCEALVLIAMMRKQQAVWTSIESKVLTATGRKRVVEELKEASETCFLPGEMLCGGLTSRAAHYLECQNRVRFMLLRTQFIHFEDQDPRNSTAEHAKKRGGPKVGTTVAAPVDPSVEIEEQHMKKQFNFFLYLTKVMGERLAEVVEVSELQWLVLLVAIGLFCVITVSAGGYWQFMLWLWISLGWAMLLLTHLLWGQLKYQLQMLVHADDEDLPHIKVLHQGTTPGKSPKQWIDGKPQYLSKIPTTPTHSLPEFMVGPPSKIPNQQQMFNLMLFGRNEVIFHVRCFRAIFLWVATYTAVFVVNLLVYYVCQVYPPHQAIAIAVIGLAPVTIILFFYLFEVVRVGVTVTSVESMRVRKVSDQVVRHQKEHNAVWLMSIIAVIINGDKQDTLEVTEIEEMKAALEQDEVSDQRGEPSLAVTTLIQKRLGDRGDTELVMERLLSIFDSVDDDHSGELSEEEIYQIFKEIGFDSPEDVDACLKPMLSHIPEDMMLSYPKVLPPPPQPGQSGGLCVPDKDIEPVAPPPPKPVKTISKAIFLAWMLHLEKQAQHQSAHHVAHTWFTLIDDDGSGHVSVVELQEVLQSCGKAFTADDVSALILELDTNGDGAFDEHEFTAWFARHMRS